MTLFDSLFELPAVRNRHNTAPLCKERVEYLTYAQGLGRRECCVKLMASHLLQINRVLGFTARMRPVTIGELENLGRKWEVYAGPLRRRTPGKSTYEVFMQIARPWLRFHSCLVEPVKTRFADKRLRDYERWLKDERGVIGSTTKARSKHAMYFLKWLAEHRITLHGLNPSHLVQYLETKKAGGWALSTRVTAASCLRIFLTYSEGCGLVSPALCETVPIFVRPKHSFTQRGPSWTGVRRMIASLDRIKPICIRDHAMILLMAVYGLRSGEIRGLRMTDVDFQNRVVTVARRKTRRTQRFPLIPEASNAIQKYINRVRPTSESPELFLTIRAPWRPMSHGALYHRTIDLFRRSGVQSLQKGPHAFRHACANQLMEKGASLRDIGAFLGHRDFRSVREYARYDVQHLRQIAEFSLKGLL